MAARQIEPTDPAEIAQVGLEAARLDLAIIAGEDMLRLLDHEFGQIGRSALAPSAPITTKRLAYNLNAARGQGVGEPVPERGPDGGALDLPTIYASGRKVWAHYASARGLPPSALRHSQDNAAVNALADALATWLNALMAAPYERHQRKLERRAEAETVAAALHAELLAGIDQMLPQLEAFADALADAGRGADAGWVRRKAARVLELLRDGRFPERF